jgi:hypothetical protein
MMVSPARRKFEQDLQFAAAAGTHATRLLGTNNLAAGGLEGGSLDRKIWSRVEIRA